MATRTRRQHGHAHSQRHSPIRRSLQCRFEVCSQRFLMNSMCDGRQRIHAIRTNWSNPIGYGDSIVVTRLLQLVGGWVGF